MSSRLDPVSWISQGLRDRLLHRLRRARPDVAAETVEDALHDVLLRVFERLATAGPAPSEPANWDAYMYRAVTNRLHDFHRTGKREVLLAEPPAQATDGSIPDHWETVERTAAFHQLLHLLSRAGDPDVGRSGAAFTALQRTLAERLNGKQWMTLQLRGVQGLGVQACAEVMGASVGSIHNWYRQALEICATALADHGIDAGDVL